MTPVASSLLSHGTVEVPARMDAKVAEAPAARIAVLIVTWNRKQMVGAVLEAVARQNFPMEMADVIVVDNASTDGTLEYLSERFRPEVVVDNPTQAAHEPCFQGRAGMAAARNTLGFGSLTLIRNTENFGGCGGFNTLFAYVERAAADGTISRPDYLWLVDDDVDLPDSTLPNLARVIAADADVGLVGSRTCDIRERDKTIETTIYYNRRTGLMQDEAPWWHPRYPEFSAWKIRVRSVRGKRPYTGTMNVDVVSACSMLARWDAVVGGEKSRGRAPVGFWDYRYFIYCDDADWCLRFGKRGWKVVLNLDAVVYHTPWLMKLTPARIYYANRNRLWMARKVLDRKQLRRATLRGVRMLLRESLYAAMHRRLFHAHIMLDTLDDARTGRSGKTASDGPAAMPIVKAFEAAGAIGADGAARRVVMVSAVDEALPTAATVRATVESQCRAAGLTAPEWVEFVHGQIPGGAPEGSVRYSNWWPARLANQVRLAWFGAATAIVIDQRNDLPMFGPRAPRFTVHVDSRDAGKAQVERDTWRERVAFLKRWCACATRSVRWTLTVEPQPDDPSMRYG